MGLENEYLEGEDDIKKETVWVFGFIGDNLTIPEIQDVCKNYETCINAATNLLANSFHSVDVFFKTPTKKQFEGFIPYNHDCRRWFIFPLKIYNVTYAIKTDAYRALYHIMKEPYILDPDYGT